jgi:pterin-4a-carbinolamine dehydratase
MGSSITIVQNKERFLDHKLRFKDFSQNWEFVHDQRVITLDYSFTMNAFQFVYGEE